MVKASLFWHPRGMAAVRVYHCTSRRDERAGNTGVRETKQETLLYESRPNTLCQPNRSVRSPLPDIRTVGRRWSTSIIRD